MPTDGRAVINWPNRDTAYDDVARGIAKLAKAMRNKGIKAADPAAAGAKPAPAATSTPSPPHPDPLPPGEGGTRDSGRVRAGETPVPKDGVYVGVDPRELPDLAVFKDVDAPWCPELVVIPVGSFLMGSPPNEPERSDAEGPHHRAIIGYRFAIGRYLVTFEEYDHFCEETDREKPADERWGRRGRRPVINVSWRDAQAYCEWLAKETGQPYRLPSEAEWEYACRAGTTTRYAFGNTITPKDANYIESMIGKTTEVGSYPPNPWSVYDLHGNVWEWVEDVWHDDYKGAPADGSAWTDSKGKQSSRNRIVRGGSWGSIPGICRSANRDRYVPGNRNLNPGFRVAKTLD